MSLCRPGVLVVESPEHETRFVREYVEGQAHERVLRLEKVASERVMGTLHDVWDVRTETDRWWVVSDPMNLYSHEQHPSMDYVLSFHCGLMLRVFERQRKESNEGEEKHLPRTWRRFGQAIDAFNSAEEAEDFQAVGVRLRECLLTFAREAVSDQWPPVAGERPKAGDFKGWAVLMAAALARGRPRSYVRALCEESWDLVSWLVHERNAVRDDADLALDATRQVLDTLGIMIVRQRGRRPERCPECDSYRLVSDYRPELDSPPLYVVLCAACGWEEKAQPWCGEGREAALKEGFIPEDHPHPHFHPPFDTPAQY